MTDTTETWMPGVVTHSVRDQGMETVEAPRELMDDRLEWKRFVRTDE